MSLILEKGKVTELNELANTLKYNTPSNCLHTKGYHNQRCPRMNIVFHLLEESAQQTSGQIIHDSSPESSRGISRSLAEPIAPGESHRVGDGQNQGNC